MSRQIPIGVAHISFSGRTGLSKLPVGQPRVAPGGHWRLTGWTNTQRSTGPGVKIKMTLESAEPKGKGLGGNCKTKVGPCWRSFIQSELSRGSHNTQPRKGHKIKKHNTGMSETRATRVEQNTRHKAEPSTLYQVYRCIKVNKI